MWYRNTINSAIGHDTYNTRYDFNADGAVNVLDVLLFRPVINSECSNP
jgi:hypothetical protein